MCYNVVGDVPSFSSFEVVNMSRERESASDLENAISAYESGENLKAVARRFHIGHRLRRALIERGTLRPRLPSLPVSEIVARYVAGESENALANVYCTTRAVVRSHLRSAGITLRGQTEANRLSSAARTPEQHRRYVEAAHIAARAHVQSFDEKAKRAKTRQERGLGVSPAELLLAEWLKQRGIEMTPQLAIGPYNVDLGTYPVAVEIFGGGWHAYGRHRRLAPERYRYLLD